MFCPRCGEYKLESLVQYVNEEGQIEIICEDCYEKAEEREQA